MLEEELLVRATVLGEDSLLGDDGEETEVEDELEELFRESSMSAKSLSHSPGFSTMGRPSITLFVVLPVADVIVIAVPPVRAVMEYWRNIPPLLKCSSTCCTTTGSEGERV